MSVFGGDSWAREAQHRKRRVDDVVIEALPASSYRKLPSGKYGCLLCPHNPILDTPLMLSMHCKGSRHQAAESKLKKGQLGRRDEINKRIALADESPISSPNSTLNKKVGLVSKPLIQQIRMAVIADKGSTSDSVSKNQERAVHVENAMNAVSNLGQNRCLTSVAASESELVEQKLDFSERRERELKFIAAGWIRDFHGKWHKDENVEFDSDEEDPNVTHG